jgi:hypothetical protein
LKTAERRRISPAVVGAIAVARVSVLSDSKTTRKKFYAFVLTDCTNLDRLSLRLGELPTRFVGRKSTRLHLLPPS